MKPRFISLLSPLLLLGASALHADTTINIAAVNNPDILELKKLSSKYEEKNPDVHLNWVFLEENTLRQRVTTDVSTGAGQFDMVFIGLYEAPIWAKAGWLRPMENLAPEYDIDDVFKGIREGLSYEGKLYALPFYGESCFTMYRKDLFEQKGLTMPEKPTYDDIQKFAAAFTDKSKGFYGIALRGKPGWGENMANISMLVNVYGGRWFDMKWQPTLETPEWKKALTVYHDMATKYAPPGMTANGFNENLTLFAAGKAAIWLDATVAGGILENPKNSQVVGKVGYVVAPSAVTSKGSHWLWSWAFAIPNKAKSPDAAQKFAQWATSKEYIKMVADDIGWASVPPGTRKSTYDNPEYQRLAPFAKVTLESLESADPNDATVQKVPYHGITFVGIPEYQSLGSVVGQNVAGYVTGSETLDGILKKDQAQAERTMKQAGYYK